jgi:drug/metabolite transporter (DMT)-like permease
VNLLYGLVAALGWGTGDFLSRGPARRAGAYRTVFYVQFAGIALLGLYVAFGGAGGYGPLFAAPAPLWGWALLACVLNTLSTLALYRGFAVGRLSVVAPVTASYAAVTAALAVALGGERPGALGAVGILICLAGAVLVAAAPEESVPCEFGVAAVPEEGTPPPSRRAVSAGVVPACLSALGYGVAFYLFGAKLAPPLAGAPSVLLARLTSVALLAVFALPLRRSLAPPVGRDALILLAAGALDTAAFVANNVGLSRGEVALTSVVASQFSAVTVLLAAGFLRERLRPHQWAGVALVLGGVALLGLVRR